ncbi:phospholipase-like protein [Tanacetum coccineum]
MAMVRAAFGFFLKLAFKFAGLAYLDPTNETDTKTYSIEGFAWAFKTWILESFRAATDEYYTRYRRHPRIVAWSSKHKFYRHMLKPMLHGQLPVERLVPDEIEARSRWWVSSRAYFDGRSFEDEQIPRHLNRNNYFEVPSEMYREFEEQRRGYQQMKENNNDMYEKITRFMEDTRRVPEANTTPIIPDQHFGVSDISGFQSYQGLPSAFHTLANNSSFLNMATPSNWQTPNPSYLGTPNSQPPIPSQHGTSNLQNPMTSYYSPNLPPPIPSHSQDAGILDPNLCDRARREPQPSVYMLSPYTVLPPTTELPKKRIDKTKKKGNTKKLSPMNLGNTFADENVSGDDVTITGVQQTDNYFNYENVDPDKVYMPINVGGVHWVTGAIDLAESIFYVFDSIESETRMLMLEKQDHPLVDYGKYALGCMTGADMKKCVYLKSVRDELLRSMEEKRQLMANYRDM